VSAHLRAQALRFVRTSGLAFAAMLLATGGHVGWSSLWAMLVGAGETGLRQLMQVEPKPTVTAVLADPPPTTDPAPPTAKG
jgi:hypothetical protein